MSGINVVREARSIRNDLPTAIISGYIDEDLRTRANASDVQELIAKPFVSRDFFQIVQRLVTS